jgi:hypothetical protein
LGPKREHASEERSAQAASSGDTDRGEWRMTR